MVDTPARLRKQLELLQSLHHDGLLDESQLKDATQKLIRTFAPSAKTIDAESKFKV